MKNSLWLLPVLALMSCGNDDTKQEKKDSVPDRVAVVVSDVQKHRPNMEFTPWEGNLRDAVYWRDSLGENIFIVAGIPQYFWKPMKPEMRQYLRSDQDPETFEEATELFAYHYVLAKGEAKWKLYAEMNDYRMGCCDVYMDYQQSTLEVVNADSDGLGEVVFMYHATEADGILTHDYIGTMILHSDTTFYYSVGATGLASAEKNAEAGREKATFAGPDEYLVYLKTKWDELYNAQLEIDRAGMESSNTEDSHEGHAH